jgi:hypothetical protein
MDREHASSHDQDSDWRRKLHGAIIDLEPFLCIRSGTDAEIQYMPDPQMEMVY